MTAPRRVTFLNQDPAGTAARLQRIAAHIPLVRPIALQVYSEVRRVFPLPDLIQEGMIGLIEACDKFDDTRGRYLGFTRYASQKIRWAIIDSVRGRQFDEIRREQRAGRIDASSETSSWSFDRCEDNGPEGSFCGEFDRCDPQPLPDAACQVSEALECLTPRQRALVMMRMEGYTQKAAGAELGISQQAARMLEVRARHTLQQRGTPPAPPPDTLQLAA